LPGAAVARLFVVRTPADQAYHTDIVFLILVADLPPGCSSPWRSSMVVPGG
jgi:hypothetical protein